MCLRYRCIVQRSLNEVSFFFGKDRRQFSSPIPTPAAREIPAPAHSTTTTSYHR